MADISIVYSGGTANTQQRDSLGGLPSPIAINTHKNNLFDNLTASQTIEDWFDYRCLYVFNDSAELKYTTSVYISYLNDLGTVIQLGYLLRDEVQRITFNTEPTNGTFTINIQDNTSDTIIWDDDPVVLAQNIQTGLESITDSTVDVAVEGTHRYNITFEGIMSNKSLSMLTITNNNLTPAPSISITRLTIGSPINTIAPDIGNQKTAPSGIPFAMPLTPKLIGVLMPSEGFPVWIKRTVNAGSEAIDNDGFSLKIKAIGSN